MAALVGGANFHQAIAGDIAHYRWEHALSSYFLGPAGQIIAKPVKAADSVNTTEVVIIKLQIAVIIGIACAGDMTISEYS